MAARWIDETEPQQDEDVVDIAVEAQDDQQGEPAPEPEPVVEPTPEDDLPEKYRGKSASEIARMHMEAEKLLGKHSSEVGELRRAFDEFVTRERPVVPASATEEASDSVDFFADPDGALDSKIDSHPAIRKAEAAARQMEAQANLNRLESAHPDYKTVISDPKFAEWVKSDQVRVALFQQADQNFDFHSANNLISTWKEKVGVAAVAVEAEKSDRSRQVKEASTGSSKPSADGSKIQKKKYRRADIIKLMRDDPDRYEAIQDEIILAYREKRVI